MLMKVYPSLEPLQRLRDSIPVSLHPTLEVLLGIATPPPDQPNCADAIGTLAQCLSIYSAEIRALRPEFSAVVQDAQAIADVLAEQSAHIQGQAPAGQMVQRLAQYPAWSLLTLIPPESVQLRTALGAEIALAFIERRQVSARYCTALRRDIDKYGRPQTGEQRCVDDLAEMQFGRGWLAHFNKADQQVRRRVEVPDPDGPLRPDHASPKHRLELLARLKWRFEYPNIKHRQASLDDSHVTVAQYRRAAAEVRAGVAAGEDSAIVCALSMVSQLAPDLVISLPLITEKTRLNCLGLDVERGALVLDLRCLFPDRKTPSAATTVLFYQASHELTIPLPVFLAKSLRLRLTQHPDARVVGDLVNWAVVASTVKLIPGEVCKLSASLARVSKSTGTVAIGVGVDRLVAGCDSWDFSLVGSARLYYARLTGKEIHAGCSKLYNTIGWGQACLGESELPAIGSMCYMTFDGVRQMFGELAQACRDSWPGRRSTVASLIKHHEAYTRYAVVLISFCLGLRPVRSYRLTANDLLNGQNLLTVHDKHGGDALMAQPATVNCDVQAQLAQYAAHCVALVERLTRLNKPEASSLKQALLNALSGDGPLFVVRSKSGAVQPAGASNIWGLMPEHLRVPANAGRHFWQNVLREKGLSSRDIDRFMRHRVVGLESNTSSQTASAQQSFDRIEKVQLEVMHELSIRVISGLRKA